MELNRDKFRKWLEGHRPRQVVGKPHERCDCPLARFLRSQGAEAPTVSYDRYSLDDVGRCVMPYWASHFALGADDMLGVRNITASRALKILDGIEQ